MDKIKLPCEIVEDILPSYVDGLTNEVTNQAVSDHLSGCKDCSRKYKSMKDPEGFNAEVPNEEDKNEIDFLKKTRRKNRLKIIAGAFLVVILAAVYTVYSAFNGSIIRKLQFTKEVKAYVAEKYPDEDFVVGNAKFDFKSMVYYCPVTSESSKDTHFAVYVNTNTNELDDRYEHEVLNKENTIMRLDTEMDEKMEKTFTDFPYETRLMGLHFTNFEEIDRSKVSLDMALDMNNLPGPAEFTVWIPTQNTEPTWEELEERLVEIKDYCESKGFNIDYYSVSLEYPYENGEPTNYGSNTAVYSVPADVIDDADALHAFVEDAREAIEKELAEIEAGTYEKDGSGDASEAAVEGAEAVASDEVIKK